MSSWDTTCSSRVGYHSPRHSSRIAIVMESLLFLIEDYEDQIRMHTKKKKKKLMYSVAFSTDILPPTFRLPNMIK